MKPNKCMSGSQRMAVSRRKKNKPIDPLFENMRLDWSLQEWMLLRDAGKYEKPWVESVVLKGVERVVYD